jgi:chromosome segregation ATPase
MGKMHCLMFTAAVLFPLAAAAAQSQAPGSGSGKIICWKDKSGKVVGCGDRVPPEYQDSATKELNQRGVTVRQSEPALTPEQKKSKQAELERKRAEEQAEEQRIAEQRRHDKALLETFSNVKDIELKLGRDTQHLELNIESLQTSLKNANDRQANARAHIEQSRKNKQPVPQALQDEFDRIESDKTKIQNQIAQKRKDIAELNQKYADMKKRFIELNSGTSDTGQTASGSAKSVPAPVTSAAPAKK